MTPLAKLAENLALCQCGCGERLAPIHLPAWLDEARALRADGMIYREIGARLGVRTEAVWKVLNPERVRREERERLDAVGWCPGFWADTSPEPLSEADERWEAECEAGDRAYDLERGG